MVSRLGLGLERFLWVLVLFCLGTYCFGLNPGFDMSWTNSFEAKVFFYLKRAVSADHLGFLRYKSHLLSDELKTRNYNLTDTF